MPIPNYRAHVADLAARDPDAWRAAHTGGPRTEDFIRRLAAELHALDPNVGLNGKRGNPDDISDDVLAIFTDDGDVTDRSGKRMAIIDVIVGAGGPDPRPGWASVGGPSPGAWVKPAPIAVEPPPKPVEPPPPAHVCKCEEHWLTVRNVLTVYANETAALLRDLRVQSHQIGTLNEQIAELQAQVTDVRQCFSTGLTVEADADLRVFGQPVRGRITGKASV
jgi:hypothetical protein